MPSVVMCNMHNRVFDAFCRIFKHIGYDVYTPKNGESNYFIYDGASSAPGVVNKHAQEKTLEEVLDIKPDMVLCCCWEQLKGSQRLAQLLNKPLVLRAGNNNVPYRPEHSEYLISSDQETYDKSNIKHKLMIMLPPDYDLYKPDGKYQFSSMVIPTLIHHYKSYWLKSYKIYKHIRHTQRRFAFVHFGYSGSPGLNEPYIPVLGRQDDIVNMLHIGRALLHIKEMEGYGWTLLEAAAAGVPIIAVRDYVQNRTSEKFLIENETCLFINEATYWDDFNKAIHNESAMLKIAENGSNYIRDLINLEEQAANIKKFLEEKVLK